MLSPQSYGSHHAARFAEHVSHIAYGMLALAKSTKRHNMQVVPAGQRDKLSYPTLDLGGAPRMVVLINKYERRCDCPIAHADTFGPEALLGLKAVTLQAGLSRHSEQIVAQLGIVIPQWPNRDKEPNAHRVICFNLKGYVDQADYWFIGPPSVPYSLGIELRGGPVEMRLTRRGGVFNDCSVGFPGGVKFMIKDLPDLREYFASWGNTLSPDHRCATRYRD
ncbi:MAG TPA: hypothetical protein VLF59_00455 [Candidatus Saccharimonadales bacterium]|nr:hypothetical protein [Candidatus Saccharimonadales bacterium]